MKIEEQLKTNFTTEDSRRWHALQTETGRLWKKFWVGVMFRRGYTSSKISKELEIPESTVRRLIKEE